MTTTDPQTPVADVDEALVEACVERLADMRRFDAECTCADDHDGLFGPWDERAARAVLAHLAATGRLVGEGEERVEWNARMRSGGLFWIGPELVDEKQARHIAGLSHDAMTVVNRTVRTWMAPGGSTGTLVGPWVEVEG